MKYYNVFDNSYCINVDNGNHAYLVQQHSNWYNPDKDEDGAMFEIVSEPYTEDIYEFGVHYGKKTFINVKSSNTGKVYRTLYNKIFEI